MHSTARRLPSIIIGLAVALAAQGVCAIGWLRAQQSAVLGQPLDFTAALRLDPGDTVAAECIRADVTIGDQRVLPAGVRVLVDDSAADAVVMRVQTTQAVDEPVVSVQLAIGCPERMARRFVVLADPPLVVVAAAPLAAAADPVARSDGRPVATPTAERAAARAEAAAQNAAAREDAARRAVAAREAARERRREQRRQAPAAPAAVTATAVAPSPAVPPQAAPAAAPRLRLDTAEVVAAPQQQALDTAAASAVAEAIEVVAQAASAARASAAAASAAEERVASLERTVAQMRADARAGAPLRGLQDDGLRRWLPLVLAALLLLALAVGWLGWRVLALQRERQQAWQRAAARRDSMLPPEGLALPIVTTEVAPVVPARTPATAFPTGAALPPPPATAPATLQPLPPADSEVPTPVERTEALPPRLSSERESSQPRDVSIEELLDLEQQAEFFIVLGQDDAAIDLLVEHLRSTGGGSPLPYLKLLETYRRRDERDAYERTRARFNHRFNAYAPDWDTDLAHGRSLEDYPGVLPRLQQVWPRPLDAMAELEALLFRKSRGELFELPAYREVLFLYSLARDLLDREAADTGTVDVLLPLSDGGEFSATSPHPYFGLERDSVFDGGPMEDRVTQPVDLDLTQPETRPMIELPPARG